MENSINFVVINVYLKLYIQKNPNNSYDRIKWAESITNT